MISLPEVLHTSIMKQYTSDALGAEIKVGCACSRVAYQMSSDESE